MRLKNVFWLPHKHFLKLEFRTVGFMHIFVIRSSIASLRKSSVSSIVSAVSMKSQKSIREKVFGSIQRKQSAGSVKSMSSMRSVGSARSIRTEKSVAISLGGKSKEIKVKEKLDVSERMVHFLNLQKCFSKHDANCKNINYFV